MSMLRVIILSSLLIFINACGTKEKSADTAEGAYQIAKEYETEERYEVAIQKYQDLRNKYIYSKYAVIAELAIADCYFKQESFPEAQLSYQNFKDLHPKHPQIDYVTYQLALSFYNQLPSTSDRDLSVANNTLLYLEEVYKFYPQSSYAKDALEKKQLVLKMLVEKEIYIADYYFKKQKYLSALRRYEMALLKYPGLGFDAKVLSKGVLAALKIGQKEKAKELFEKLKAKHADSDEYQDAKKEML